MVSENGLSLPRRSLAGGILLTVSTVRVSDGKTDAMKQIQPTKFRLEIDLSQMVMTDGLDGITREIKGVLQQCILGKILAPANDAVRDWDRSIVGKWEVVAPIQDGTLEEFKTFLDANREPVPQSVDDKSRTIATEFCKVLREWLTPEQMREVVKRNETYGADVCATHDFCDANMAMLEAFTTAGERTILDCEDGTPEFEDATALWNRVWDMAKAAKFSL